jgi:hypothetical protein
VQNMPSREEELDALFQVLKYVVMHPVFKSVVAEIQSLPPSERLQAVSKQLTPKALEAKGLRVPEGFTFTPFAVSASHDLNTGKANSTAIGKNTVLGFKFLDDDFWMKFLFS